MATLKESTDIEAIILKELMPTCKLSEDKFSVYDATFDNGKNFYIIEFKRRYFDSNKYNTLMLENTKLKALLKVRDGFKLTVDKPIKILYVNALNDAVFTYDIDNLIESIRNKEGLITFNDLVTNQRTASDISDGSKVNKSIIYLNTKLAWKKEMNVDLVVSQNSYKYIVKPK